MNDELVIPEADLPDWIRQAKRGVDWGVLIVLLLSLAGAWSFVLNDGLPRTSLSESVAFRTEDTATALREGRLYPRWSPHAFYGYGAPIPHYYPPATTYLPALFNVLLTNDSVIGIRLAFVLTFVMAGGATYALVLRRTDAVAGVISALLFVYSPYFGLVAPSMMGDLQSMMGMALIPMWLWALDRVYSDNKAVDSLWLALATTAVVLTDPLRFGLATFALGIVWTGYQLWAFRAWRHILPSAFAIALGITIGAFHWLPSLNDINAVRWQTLDKPMAQSLSLPSLVEPLRQLDIGAMNPPTQLTLGVAMVFFAVASAGVIVLIRPNFNIHTLMLGMGAILIVLGVTIWREQTWLTGVISFCLAIGASGMLYLRPLLRRRKIARQYFIAIVIGIIVLSVNVWVSNRRVENFGSLDGTTQLRYEQSGYGIAVVPYGGQIPSNIPLEAPPNAQLLQGYQNNLFNRLVASVTITDQITLLDNQSHQQRYQVRLLNTLNSDVLLANFVGWQAYLDERLLNLQPTPNGEILAMTIPARNNADLVIRLAETPVQQLAWGMSWGAFVLIVGITWRKSRRNAPTHMTYSTLLHVRDARLLAVAIGIMVLFGAITSSTLLSRTLRLPRNYALSTVTPLNNRTNSAIELLGYEINQTEFAPNDTLDLTLFWQASRTVDENYKIQVSLNNVENGQTVYTSELALLGGIPSRRWQANTYVLHNHTFSIPSSVPSGRYVVVMSLFPCVNRNLECSPEEAIIFFDPSSNLIGKVFTLPRILSVR
jgi:hypothetical protein